MPPSVHIAVDSTSDLPLEWRARWNIAVIPAFVTFGTESIPDDGVSLTRPDFYRRLAEARTLPGTAAPPADLAEQILSDHLDGVEQVLVFTVAHQFSSLYNSIRLAAQRVDQARVTVIDSGTVSMGLGWQVLAAAETAARGGDKAACVAAAQSARERLSFYAAIDTLEYLRRGGRVSGLVAGLGTLLQIKPILTVYEGTADTVNRVRTMGKGLQALADAARKDAPLERLAILHSNAPHLADQLKALIPDLVPNDQNDHFLIGDIAVAIGTHTGPGCAGVIAVKKQK